MNYPPPRRREQCTPAIYIRALNHAEAVSQEVTTGTRSIDNGQPVPVFGDSSVRLLVNHVGAVIVRVMNKAPNFDSLWPNLYWESVGRDRRGFVLGGSVGGPVGGPPEFWEIAFLPKTH